MNILTGDDREGEIPDEKVSSYEKAVWNFAQKLNIPIKYTQYIVGGNTIEYNLQFGTNNFKTEISKRETYKKTYNFLITTLEELLDY